MKQAVLVRGARQLLTLNGSGAPRRGDALRDLSIIEDGSVLIVNGVVAHVGPTRRVENLAEARTATEVDATGRVVMPAFVDGVTHLMSACEEPRERGGTRSSHLAQHSKSFDLGKLDFQARRILAACARHGTATIEARAGCGFDAGFDMRALRAAAALNRLRVIPTYPVHSPSRSEDGYLEWLEEAVLTRVQSRRLARFVSVPCCGPDFDALKARQVIDACKRHGLNVKVDAEGSDQSEAVALALETEATTIDSMSEVTDEEAAALSRSGAVAMLVPGTVFAAAADRYPPARALIEAGAAVALGSGFRHKGHSTFSMQMVVAMACTYMNMTVAEAISAATINSACALRVDQHIGSLQFGKDADLLILNVPDYREMSYYFGVNVVNTVMRQGRVIYGESDVPGPQEER